MAAVLAAGCAAPSGAPDAAPPDEGAPCAPARYDGVVASVRATERGVESILVESENATYPRIHFDLSEATLIERTRDGACAPATGADLERGARVAVDHAAAMTRSDPPMTRAYRIVLEPAT